MTIPNKWNRKSSNVSNVSVNEIIRIGICNNEHPKRHASNIQCGFIIEAYFFNINMMNMKYKVKVTTEHNGIPPGIHGMIVNALNGKVIISITKEKSAIKMNKYHLIFFLFNRYKAKPTIEQSDIIMQILNFILKNCS